MTPMMICQLTPVCGMSRFLRVLPTSVRLRRAQTGRALALSRCRIQFRPHSMCLHWTLSLSPLPSGSFLQGPLPSQSDLVFMRSVLNPGLLRCLHYQRKQES